MDNNFFNILPSDSNTSKIIRIKGQYFAEVKNNNVHEFLSKLELSLSHEVDILKERLQSLEEQIKEYQD